jgi:para-nitrobenzyl esterase
MMRKSFIAVIVMAVLSMMGMLVVGCGNKAATDNRKASSTMEVPQLDSGPISGSIENGIWTYKGIPYAAPPVGELRWKEPQPVEPWQDVKACTSFGPSCPQGAPVIPALSKEINDVGPTSEDCLYLNVWTPAQTPGERLPVMVWIHGGGFTSGSAYQIIYDGHNLARKGVMLVTINYRLGALGFMAHAALSHESPNDVSGNYGLLDQIAALQWVQRNADVFGGDPGNVTVFGESAGGASVCDLMASSLTGGLFQKAIVESGGFLDMGLPANPSGGTLSAAEQTGAKMAQALGCDTASDVIACMRAKTADEILQAQEQQNSLIETGVWSPVVDGYVLSDKAQNIFAAGRQQKVPLLIGTNANEAAVLARNITDDQYRTLLAYVYGSKADQIASLYPVQAPGTATASFIKLLTEMGFAAPSKFAAASMANVEEPSYLYKFTMTPGDPRIAQLGAFHGLEIIYVFGNLDKVSMQNVRAEDKALSETMMGYWVNFASNGDPNGSALPGWPAYVLESDQFQELGMEVATTTGYYPEAYAFLIEFSGL